MLGFRVMVWGLGWWVYHTASASDWLGLCTWATSKGRVVFGLERSFGIGLVLRFG